VLTRSGLDHSLRFWKQDEVDKWIVTPDASMKIPDGPRNRLLVSPAQGNPAAFVAKQLKDAGYQKVLLFGGGDVNRLFYEAGLVDELCLTLCPLMLGAPQASNLLTPPLFRPVHFRLESSKRDGDLLFLNYSVHKQP
jgi:5-amino-6-(5-phosphoribosylamino)uracil reductase